MQDFSKFDRHLINVALTVILLTSFMKTVRADWEITNHPMGGTVMTNEAVQLYCADKYLMVSLKLEDRLFTTGDLYGAISYNGETFTSQRAPYQHNLSPYHTEISAHSI